MSNQLLTISNFTGGINDSEDPSSILDIEVSDALNMHINSSGIVESRKGQLKLVTGNIYTTAEITSIFGMTLSTGSEATILTTSIEMYALSATNVLSTLNIGFTPIANVLWRWVGFNDHLIGVSDKTALGTANPVAYWNGSTGSNVVTLNQTVTASITSPIDIAIWNNRVCIAQGVEVFFSDASEQEDWLSGDSQVIRFRGTTFDEENITAIFPFQGKLIVFKKSSIWEIDPGDGPAESWVVRQIGFNIGCDARFSIVDIGRDLLFANQSGYNSLADIRDRGGLAPSGRVTQNVYRNYWATIDPDYIHKIVAIFNPHLEEVMVAFPYSGSTKNNMVMIINTRYSQINGKPSIWMYTYNSNPACFSQRPNIDRELIEMGSQDGQIMRLNSGTGDGTTTATYTSYVKYILTKRFDFKEAVKNKEFNSSYLYLTQSDDKQVSVTIYFNNQQRSKTYAINVYGVSAKWDVAKWDVDKWSAVKKGIHKGNLTFVARDIQYSILNNNDQFTFSVDKIIIDLIALEDDVLLGR